METQRKFKLKKQIKTYLSIAWSMLGFFILYVVVIICSGKLFGEPLAGVFAKIFGVASSAPVVLIVAITLLVVPLFGSLMFTMLSQSSRQELYCYKNGIRLYRTRKYARQILELIQEGSLDAAIDIYKKFDLGFDKRLDDYVFGILLGSCRFSGNEEQLKTFNRKVDKIKEVFDPNKVIL